MSRFVSSAALSVTCIAMLLSTTPAVARYVEPEPITLGLRLIDAAYPGLRAGAAVIRAEAGVFSKGPWFREFSLHIGDSREDLRFEEPTEAVRYAFFRASISFDDLGLKRLGAFGRFVKFQENDAFAKAVFRQPNWSDADIVAALRDRGAQYGPHRESMKIEVAQFAAMLADVTGTEPLIVTAVSFRIPSLVERGRGLGAGAIGWEVVYSPASGRKDFAYEALYEPFDGKLFWLFRRDA